VRFASWRVPEVRRTERLSESLYGRFIMVRPIDSVRAIWSAAARIPLIVPLGALCPPYSITLSQGEVAYSTTIICRTVTPGDRFSAGQGTASVRARGPLQCGLRV
jgi:hypothetical protein